MLVLLIILSIFVVSAYYILITLNTINNKYRAVIWDKGNHTLSNSDYMNPYKPISVLNIVG